MPLISFALVLVVIGVLLFVINKYIPMEARIKQILNAAVVVAVVLWILELFGVFSMLSGIRIGH